MSGPDLDIIHSPEAETFLRSVTAGFYDRSWLGLWMYEVIGREWDEMSAWSNDLKWEIFVQTCTWSIAVWEWVYGFEPDESMTLEERRQRIMSKIRGVRPVNPEALRRGISAVSGADADVTDFSAPYSFSVRLGVTNKPVPMERVLQFIYETRPAHLSASVEVVFPQTESALRFNGAMAVISRLPIPEQADTFRFEDTLRIGGRMASVSTLPIPEIL